jgi:hypothetical protein
MGDDKEDVCCNCGCNKANFSKTQRMWAFSLTCNKKQFTVKDALEGIIKFGGGTSTIAEKNNQGKRRVLCPECERHVSNAYSEILKFTDKTTDTSYMKEKVSPVTPLPPTPEKKVIVMPSKPKTPVVEKLDKYVKHPKMSVTFHNKVRRLVNHEMQKLLKKTSLRSVKMTRDNWIPPTDEIITELKTHAPIIYRVLQGMVARDQTKNSKSPVIRTIIAVAMRNRNMFVNSFQKTVGLILFKGKATVEVSLKLPLCFFGRLKPYLRTPPVFVLEGDLNYSLLSVYVVGFATTKLCNN